MADDELARISVRVGPSHPELLEDLQALPAHARAERLRALATAALLMRGASGAIEDEVPAPGASRDTDPADDQRRSHFQGVLANFDDAD